MRAAGTGRARLAIIGGGAWGTALAIAAGRAGAQAVMWTRNPDVATAINTRHQNPIFLPGATLEPEIVATTEFAAAVAAADAVLLAVPAQALRGVLEAFAPALVPGMPLLHCAKGIELGSLALMSEVGREIVPQSPWAVLSGPSFAAEVAGGLPTAVTIAAPDAALARSLQMALGSARFRPYLSADPVGVQLGGALKNVIAIACGIIVGHGLGENARSALVTRGLAEIIRLGAAMGARSETFHGLSGIGDLVLTCTARQSRNYRLGLGLGRPRPPDAAGSGQPVVVEGVATAAAIARLALRLGVEMPISAAVAAVLHQNAPIAATIERLLQRPYRSE